MNPANRTASSSTRPGASPLPRPQQVNTQTKVLDTIAGRILCIADLRGRLSSLNDLAREANAKAVIHTGDFGFFESSSLGRINDRTLRHLTMYSPLIPNAQRQSLLAPENPPSAIRTAMTISLLSEFPLLLSGQVKLNVPVFTVWGACEDVLVLEKFRQGTYEIENLHIIDEATTRCLDVGGVKLRLLGLGGAFVPHKMFDNGDGNATIAGGQGTMWTTALQIGELVDTAQRVFDPTETRLLVTHASPGREGIIAQLALLLKADLTISAGLHFRYTSSWNEFSVQGDFEGFRHKILSGKEGFDKIWESVKTQVEEVIDDNQRIFLEKALSVIEKVPPAQANLGAGGTATGEEPAWKNCWNWNLCDAAYGSLVLDIREGRVSAELKSQGFNYAYRRSATPSTTVPTPSSVPSALPANAQGPSSSGSPAPTKAGPASRLNGPSAASPAPQVQTQVPQPHTEAPSKDAMAKINGAGTTRGTGASTPVDKAEREKAKRDKKREKKDKGVSEGKENVAEEDSAAVRTQSGKATPDAGDARPASAAGASAVADAEYPASPASGVDSPGVRTPTSRRPPRHPWTIFIKYSTQATEAELRDFFGEAKSSIVRVHLLPSYGKPTRSAFVEFGDEESMRLGLTGHADKLKDSSPYVVQAEDREARDNVGGSDRGIGFRGRGGRGGRGSGFAARGLAAAGLTRAQAAAQGGAQGTQGTQGAPVAEKKANGDVAVGGAASKNEA